MGKPEAVGAGPDSSIHRADQGQSDDERLQFVDSHDELPYEARELVQAIGAHILMRRRRFMTHDEFRGVVQLLGYHQ